MPEHLNPEIQLEELKTLRKQYEEALSNAQKSGDYSEAERLKEELEARLSALEALFPKEELKAEPAEVIDKKETTYEKAQEIMGEDFFGGAAVYEAFGEAVADSLDKHSEHYKLPYSERDLIEAKKNGEMLIARVGSYYPEPGTLHFMTMAELHDIASFKMDADDFKGIRALGAFSKELFYNSDTIKSRWVLVKKDFIPDSNDKNYIEQTRLLRDYLNNLGLLTDMEFKSCDDSVLNEILKHPYKGTKEVNKKLTDLPINQKYRRSPAEAFYDWMLLKSAKKTKLRFHSYPFDWGNGLNSKSEIVATINDSHIFDCIGRNFLEFDHARGVISAR